MGLWTSFLRLKQLISIFNDEFIAKKIRRHLCPYVVSSSFTLHKICEDTGFHWPIFSRIRTKSKILSLYGRIRVSEKPVFLECFMHCQRNLQCLAFIKLQLQLQFPSVLYMYIYMYIYLVRQLCLHSLQVSMSPFWFTPFCFFDCFLLGFLLPK